ncbi:MAG: tetratricopeptide repeat protein [Candidatus Omnitrophota bacterium]
MIKIDFIGFLKRYYRLLSSFILLVIFFSVYNVFLIDRTLESMKFSLDEAAQAYSIDDLDGLDVLVSDAVMEEIEPHEINSIAMGNLEYTQRVLTSAKGYKQIKDMRRALDIAIKNTEEERGPILTFLDKINGYIQMGIYALSNLIKPSDQGEPIETQELAKEDIELYNKAKEFELQSKLQEAAEYYGDFIQRCPKYEKIALVKLRTAYTYQKLGQENKAQSLYRDIIKNHPLAREADISRMQLYKISRTNIYRTSIGDLLIKASELPESEKETRQEIYYNIGMLYTKLYNSIEARKFYRRSHELQPDSEMAYKSRFNSAWLEKTNYNLEESADEFLKLAQENAPEGIAVDARHQVANIYQQEGKYEEAIEIYTDLAEEYKDEKISSFFLFQAGASYMYDLNDQDKAEEVFSKLKKEYPSSPYGEFTSMDTSAGLFLTFIVPRTMRIIAWRESGLMAISGFAGEIAKFKFTMKEEKFDKGIRDWAISEFPDEIGNIKFDLKETDFTFTKDKARATGIITMGKFEVEGESEGYLKKTEDDSIRLVITKAVLENIPIPPIFINMALSGIFIIIDKYFPVQITKVSMEEGAISVEGYGGERIVRSIAKVTGNVFGADVTINDILQHDEREKLYEYYEEKFPWSSFAESSYEEDVNDAFYDFLTRMVLYSGFKMLETVKDSKLDYHRSIRTFGKLDIKKDKFQVRYTEEMVNTSMNIYTMKEFPWLVGGEYLFDVKGLEFKFNQGGSIDINGYISIGRGIAYINDASNLRVKGRMRFEIEDESKLPYAVFEELTLNRRPFPVEKVNILSKTCLEMLKDGHIPLELEEIKVSEGEIMLKGEGAEDLTSRIFSQPHLFVIFHIREWDLHIAGIQKIRPQDYNMGNRWTRYLEVSQIKTLLTEAESRASATAEEALKSLQGNQK